MIDPEKYWVTGSEHAHQVALFIWASQNMKQWPELRWMFAVPNGGERNRTVASRLKAEGVKSGVSDVMLLVPRKGWNGLIIEMKKPDDNDGGSENQLAFGQFQTEQGYLWQICDHYHKARDLIVWYMSS